MTTHDLARATGNGISTITRACRRLGIAKDGRDYHLSDRDAQRVRDLMRNKPGRPKKDVDSPNRV